jgi:hypothetical protein
MTRRPRKPIDSSADFNEAMKATGAITLDDFVAYREQHNYIFKPTRAVWPAPSVDAELPRVQLPSGKKISASTWLDLHQAVQQVTRAPGEPELIAGRLTDSGGFVERDGVQVFNLYRAPKPIPGDATKADKWLGHICHVYPGDADHIAMFLAHRVQRPQEKINHALLLGGAQGDWQRHATRTCQTCRRSLELRRGVP